MTYDSQEASRHDGDIVECVRVEHDGKTWDWVSAEQDIVLPGIGRFLREAIVVGDLDYNEEDGAGSIEVEVPRSNPAALLFQSTIPPRVIRLTVWNAHRDHLDEAVVWWTGRIVGARIAGDAVTFSTRSVSQALRGESPGMVIGPSCPLLLYSARCGVDQTAFTDTVTLSGVSGRVLTGTGFASRPSTWYAGGRLYAPDTPPVQIISSTGSTVTLARAVPGLAVGAVVRASAGCDRLHATCNTKFANGPNFLGFHALPHKNPYSERVF